MKNFFLLFLLIGGMLVDISSFSQAKTALHSISGVTIFDGTNQFIDAYNSAEAGDTIYLPGALLIAYPTIDKPLQIYGAGYHPDSTQATGKTILSGAMNFGQDADGSFVQGLEVTGDVVTSYNQSVDDLTISRCKFSTFLASGDYSSPCSNITIRECVITGNVSLNNATSSNVMSNFVHGTVNNGEFNAIFNNVFFFNNGWNSTFSNVDNSSIANNVIFSNAATLWPEGSEYNSFSNNVFSHSPDFLTNTSMNNYFDVDLTGFFVNQSGNAFEFDQDYHLTDPILYEGNDGSEVGVFGGLYPFKVGTLPENPHVQIINIDSQTNEDAQLNIQIQVGAQQD